MSAVEDALNQFRDLMLAKFQRRAERHPDDDVCVDENLRRLTAIDVDRHYWAEVEERWGKNLTDGEMAAEDIDVANLAFLSWFIRSGAINLHRTAPLVGRRAEGQGAAMRGEPPT